MDERMDAGLRHSPCVPTGFQRDVLAGRSPGGFSSMWDATRVARPHRQLVMCSRSWPEVQNLAQRTQERSLAAPAENWWTHALQPPAHQDLVRAVNKK